MNETNDQSFESATQNATEGLSPFYGDAKQLMDKYCHCSICGANLHLTHITDFSRNLTQETARCPECGVQARRVMHRLQ